MRRFTPEYLRETRRGLWDDRDALAPLFRESPDRILDVGAGTGEFSRVLGEESAGTVLSLDADVSLLRRGEVTEPVLGDATRLPFRDGSFDLVACQALLVNLPDPVGTLREFRRVSAGLVAAVEPDNGGVTVESTVPAESRLSRRARAHYLEGLATSAELGADLADRFERAGIADVTIAHRTHERRIEPPYSAAAFESARRKVTAARIDEHRETMLSGGLEPAAFDRLRDDWQAMGRAVVDQLRAGTYRRIERVPFYVAVGRA
ncbi:MAG: class I SAM-dependent methyltransferase [Halodesulfurarchaeum sp.]